MRTPTVAVDLSREDHAEARRLARRVGTIIVAEGREYARVSRDWWEATIRRPARPARPASPKTDSDDPPECSNAPSHGPGAELHRLIGREPAKGCGCRAWICKMNRWGVYECAQRREEIIDALMDNAKAFGKWWEKAAAKVAPGWSRDYVASMVDRAIQAAAEESAPDHQTN